MVIEDPATVSVLVRSAPVLTATVNVAVPLPVPLPVAKVTNAALLAAVHVQAVPAVTVMGTDPVPPSGPKVVVGCTTLNAQEGAVVTAASFLLQAAENSAATRPRMTGPERRQSAIMRAPSSAPEKNIDQIVPRARRHSVGIHYRRHGT
jgi:hypothetical protein